MTLKENTHVIRYYEKIKEYKTLELFFEATNLELEVFKENKFVYLKDLLNDASIDKTIKCNLTDETLKVIENANSFTRRDRTCGTWAGRLEGIPGKNLFNNALIVRLLENTMNEKLSREEWKAQVLKVLETTSIDRKSMTTEKVEELRNKMFNKFAELAIEELKLLKNKENSK